MMMTVEVGALELIPAELDERDFGLLPCTGTCPYTCQNTFI